MAGLILGLDFGGTKLAAATYITHEDQLEAREIIASSEMKSAEVDRGLMLELARSVLGGRRPTRIGVSFGGPIDLEKGAVRLSHHVSGWEGFPLRAWLEKEFGAQVVVDNDANCAGLAEQRRGAGRDCHSLLYVTVSTGVGAAWILDGEIYRGAAGLAGELGHIRIVENGRLCTCGACGCVEAHASGLAIAQAALERLKRKPQIQTELRKRLGAGKSLTAMSVAEAAQHKDPFAVQILHEAASVLGRGIGAAIMLMNPERVVLGGGVSKAGRNYIEAVTQAALEVVLPEHDVNIMSTALGDDGPLWGAILMAIGGRG
jgi:glucokinase